MKRHQEEDLNTAEFWDKFWSGERGQYESHACPDVAFLLAHLTLGKQRTLDVGCGTGRYFSWILSEDLHGIEISPAAAEKARTVRPRAIVTVADVVKNPIPYPTHHFDVVYCGEMLEHVEDPKRLVDELYRVTMPDGIVVMNTPYEDEIPADAHLWFIDLADIHELFKDFINRSIFRFSNSDEYRWEHFLVVATK